MRHDLVISLTLALSSTAACNATDATDDAEPLASTAPGRSLEDAPPLLSPRPPLDVVVPGDDDTTNDADDGAPVGPPWPIILVHGFSGWMDFGSVGYFYDSPSAMAACGTVTSARRGTVRTVERAEP